MLQTIKIPLGQPCLPASRQVARALSCSAQDEVLAVTRSSSPKSNAAKGRFAKKTREGERRLWGEEEEEEGLLLPCRRSQKGGGGEGTPAPGRISPSRAGPQTAPAGCGAVRVPEGSGWFTVWFFFSVQGQIEVESETVFKLAALILQVSASSSCFWVGFWIPGARI